MLAAANKTDSSTMITQISVRSHPKWVRPVTVIQFPAFHLRDRPCNPPKMPARRPQVSTLLRLHSARRRLGRSILGGYVASHVHGFQTSFELFDSEGHFSVLQGSVLWSRWPGGFRSFSDHYVSRAFCHMRLTRTLAECAHGPIKQAQRILSTS
jgi:hypothetical protein